MNGCDGSRSVRAHFIAPSDRSFFDPIACRNFVSGIVEGRGRLLHDDPGLSRPVTLAYSQLHLVGWASLLRRDPVSGLQPLLL